MRLILPLVLLFANTLLAQGALTTHYNTTYSISSLDGGIYFDLTAHTALTLDRIDLNLASAAGTRARVEVHVRPETWVGYGEENTDWACVAVGGVVAAGDGQPSPCMLARPLGLPAGDYGVALRVVGAMPNCISAPRSFSTADLELTGGAAAFEFLASTPHANCVFSGSLHYTLGGGPFALGMVSTFGQGCMRGARSFHESFPPWTLDLVGSRLLLTPNGLGGYDVTHGPASLPTLPAGATNLGLQRGAATFVPLPAPLSFPGGTTSALMVRADGRVMLTELGLLTPPLEGPSPTALFAYPPTVAIAWQDHDPTPTNNVYRSVDPATHALTITWWEVPLRGVAGSANTFAFTVHANGVLELRYGVVTNASGQCLVGFAAGPGSRDPGPSDLTAAAPFVTQRDDLGLGLSTRGRPVLGTSMTFSITGTHPQTLCCTLGFARPSTAPPIDLGPLGAPGCVLQLDPARTMWGGIGPALERKTEFPRAPSLLGVALHAQAAAFRPSANALGLVTSQGVGLVLGSL